MPTDPVNIEVADRIRKGELGKIAKVVSTGVSGGHKDPPKRDTIESRLHGQVWDGDMELSGSYILAYDIHAIDAAIWVLGRRPVAAMGLSRIARLDAHGTSHDVCGVVYEYDDGVFQIHSGIALPNGVLGELSCGLFSAEGSALVDYFSEAHFMHRRPNGEKETYKAKVKNLYEAGAVRNIAAFYQDIVAGRCDNPTAPRAVDGVLACILGREAALRHGRLTMEELIKEDRRLEPDLTGLKA
jgi:predicted dehydrogenase